MSEIPASREAIYELVHRFAGDDRLDEFGEAVDAFERCVQDHWKSEFESCYDSLTEARRDRDDLAMLTRLLIRKVRKTTPDDETARKALDFLTRHNLQGSPLR